MYEVEPLEGLGRIPDDLLAPLAELRTTLEVSPWTTGEPLLSSNPSGIRVISFAGGSALLVFGVSEEQRRVWLFDLVVL